MRRWMVPLFACTAVALSAQVRINEVKCTRTAGSNGQGADGDWLELYNSGQKEVDLGGYVLALDGQLHPLPAGLTIGPGKWQVLWCGQAGETAPDQLAFSLPRKGGTLLLVAPDRTTVLDIFHWPALPPGISIGRSTDGANGWGYFTHPTPGSANQGAVPKLMRAPSITPVEGRMAMNTQGEGTIRYTLDATMPDERSPAYKEPLAVDRGTVITARTFAPDAVPSPCTVFTSGLPDPAWALAIAPADFSGPAGIGDVPSGNHARKGRAWQRQAWLQAQGGILPIGMAIAGNGSRSLPKRNFKLLCRDRFGSSSPVKLPDGSAWHEVLLRADGTPNAFLRNLIMEALVRRSGGRLDAQPSFPLPLYLNGMPQGLYRAMPAKGKEWARSLNGGAPVDLVEGPGASAVSGDAMPYRRMLKAIAAGRPLDSLMGEMDASSLVELACFDLWTGRADHELNVRCWRSQAAGSRWRWVLFDMDQWAPVEDRTVQRMCSSALPETPFLGQILAADEFKNTFLARIAALMATTLSPGQTIPLADSLFSRYHVAMASDQRIWKERMEVPSPQEAHANLLAHLQGRNRNIQRQLAAYTGREIRALAIGVEPALAGQVFVEELPFTSTENEMNVFSGVPMHLRAVPAPGMEFAGWKGAEGNADRLAISMLRNKRITALFRPVGVSSKGGLQQRLE